MASSRFSLSSSLARAPNAPRPPPTLSSPISRLPLIPNTPSAAAVDGLSKLRGPVEGCPIRVVDVAGDFLNCCGEERGPRGEKAACAGFEKGVDTGGVAAAI